METENNEPAVKHDKPPETQHDAEDTPTPPVAKSAQGAARNDPQKADKKHAPKGPHSVYTADELIGAARTRFNASPDVVGAALKFAGKYRERLTIVETQQLIKDFMERKVN